MQGILHSCKFFVLSLPFVSYHSPNTRSVEWTGGALHGQTDEAEINSYKICFKVTQAQSVLEVRIYSLVTEPLL